jgi:probable rRNA maturation factor
MITIDPPSSPVAELPALSKSALTRFLNRARAAVGLAGEVEVLLTSDAEIKRLNRHFRRKNKATDILSFPAPPEAGVAGDLAISLETAARQAAEHGHTLND